MKKIQQINNENLNKWMDGKSVHLIDPSKIELVEPIHRCGGRVRVTANKLEEYSNQEIITRTIIVRPYKDSFALVSGYRWLNIAKMVNKPIEAIIVSPKLRHNSFVREAGIIENSKFKAPNDTESIYPIHKVRISKRIKNSTPRQDKYDLYRNYYNENGIVDKAITVVQNKYNPSEVIIVNGYIRYLVLKNSGVKYIPVKFLSEVEEI